MVNRVQYPAKTQPTFTPTADSLSMGWFRELSIPSVLAKIGIGVAAIASGPSAPVYTPPTSSLNIAWQAPLSLPDWQKPGLSAATQPAFAAPVYTPPASSLSIPWFDPLSEPVRKNPPQPASGDNQTFPAPSADSLNISWYQPLGTPVWARSGLAAADQPAYIAPLSEQPETTSVDRWYQPLSLPTWQKPGLGTAAQVAFWWNTFTPSSIVVPSFGWFEPLSTPPGARPGLAAAGQLAYTGPLSESPEATSVDRWWQNLSLPPAARQGLAASAQQFLALVTVNNIPTSVLPGQGSVVFTGFTVTITGLAMPTTVAPGFGIIGLSGYQPVVTGAATQPVGDGDDYEDIDRAIDGRFLDTSGRAAARQARLDESRRELGIIKSPPVEPGPVAVAFGIPTEPEPIITDAPTEKPVAIDQTYRETLVAALKEAISADDKATIDAHLEMERLAMLRRDDDDIIMMLAALA